MTEADWLKCEDAKAMFRWLRSQNVHRRKVGRRKLYLFGCASCRLFGEALSDPRSVAAVEYMERLADGTASAKEMPTIAEAAREAAGEQAIRPRAPGELSWREDLAYRAAEAAFAVVNKQPLECCFAHWAMRTWIGESEIDKKERRGWLAQHVRLASLLRDIFGNPFSPVSLDPVWLTTDVLALARGIYDEHAFDRMPILADALQDAGCDNEEVLGHCRSAGPHVRGCWVIDLLLGKM